ALTRLVDKSLVMVDREIPSEPRYGMLGTVKQYAQEQLNESGEGDAARTRHLDFYLALAEEAELRLTGLEQVLWFRRFEQEHENLLAALAFCEQTEDGAEKGLRLAGAAGYFWYTRGYFGLGRAALAEALTRAEGREPTRARAKAVFHEGLMATC